MNKLQITELETPILLHNIKPLSRRVGLHPVWDQKWTSQVFGYCLSLDP